VITVSEKQPSPATPNGSPRPDADLSRPRFAGGARITGNVVGHLADQARSTASAARAGRVMNADGEPGVLDLTPLRELLSDLIEELGQVRLRDRIAAALRQAADVIDTQTPHR
jgi:hypothetical protein